MYLPSLPFYPVHVVQSSPSCVIRMLHFSTVALSSCVAKRELCGRYEAGLQKLLQAEGDVAVMRDELVALQPRLVEAGAEVKATMLVVNEQARVAEAQAQVVGKEEAAAGEAAAAAKAIKVQTHPISLFHCDTCALCC
jgi:hypothetical protein